MSDFDCEKVKLKDTVSKINFVLEKEQGELDNFCDDFIGTQDELIRIIKNRKIHIKNLKYSKDIPYFARLDFVIEGEDIPRTFYIGRNGVIDVENNIIVTDWRAPISSLYYNSELGNTTYQAPQGEITGKLNLKRQFEIENGELIDYFDSSIISNDILLQKYLKSNNDNRLKNIVSTIQKEQNEVIRTPLYKNIIVQGVAGSGKTTVALHRIAYLVYNYMNTISQNEYLVIGPNPVFLNYIKSVLPELDVSNVEQTTFEEFCKEFIEEDITISSSEKKVEKVISGKISNGANKFKCSLKYKNMLDLFMDDYLSSIISRDLSFDDFVILDKEQLLKIFSLTDSEKDLKARIEETISKASNLIISKEDNILHFYQDYVVKKFEQSATAAEQHKIRKQFSKNCEEIKKGCRTKLKSYFASVKFKPTDLYKIFINNIKKYNIYEYYELDILKKQTQDNIKLGIYDFEDLSALMYLRQLSNSQTKYKNIRQVVVDEAQDLGEFNFYMLKACMPKATFSIFGDLVQSIYDYRSINDWEEVNNIMFNGEGTIINFSKSYRTTSEIMNVADSVSDTLGLGKSEIVVRHGNPVQIDEIYENIDIPNHIANKIREYITKGYKTIAVISKTNLLSRYINDDLSALGINIPNIESTDDLTDEKFNVCTISNQLAKGLEFDAVILNDVNEEIYSSENSLDMKLLYVALTRALHELDIVYSGELTHCLNKSNIIKRTLKI